MKKLKLVLLICSLIFVWSANKLRAQNDTLNDYVYNEKEVDQVPVFQGGREKMFDYVQKSISIQKPENCTGMSVVSFIVEKDGKTSHVVIERKLCREADVAVEQMVKNMPVWQAAKKDGKNVRMKIVMPVQFLASPLKEK